MSNAQAVRYGCTMLAGSDKIGKVTPIDGGYYEIPVGAYNAYNSMGMYYDANSAVPLFKSDGTLMRRLEKGVLRGEWKHPKREEGWSDADYIRRIREHDDDREAFHIRALKLVPSKDEKGRDIVLVVAELKPSGPYGHLLKEKLDNPHENVYFSVRSLTMDDMIRRVKYTREIVTWDYVGEGGIYVANKYNALGLEEFEGVEVKQHVLVSLAAEQKRRRALGLEDSSQDFGPVLKSLGWEMKAPPVSARPNYAGW